MIEIKDVPVAEAAPGPCGPKERGILFSAPMVRALLDGRKTQTRRLVKPQPVGGDTIVSKGMEPGWMVGQLRDSENAWRDLRCPYGQPGDRLWVREAWSAPYEMTGIPPRDMLPLLDVWYWADGNMPTHGDWTKPKPGIHMPRWASRLTLEVTGIRVERLQDITEEDAEAEGVDFLRHLPDADETLSARTMYEILWESINGPGSWAANPWVWCVSFRRLDNVPKREAPGEAPEPVPHPHPTHNLEKEP